jgi:glucose-1-phosphate thymidylyltransferase
MTSCDQDKKVLQEVVGLLPAGGQATRIAPLPCSKELYPIGFRPVDEDRSLRPKVVCHYLLEKMRIAGITKVYIVLRNGKWDVPAYLDDGTMSDIHLAYLVIRQSPGVPYTLNQAYPFLRDAVVAFGFPDILFQPDDAFLQLLARQKNRQPDILLGLFPADQPQKVDMVDLDDEGRVRQIAIKPPRTQLRYSWAIAVWTPLFTQFLHDYVAARGASLVTQPEVSVGHVIQAAIKVGLRVEAVPVSDEPFIDIGTPDDLNRAVRRFASQV